MTGLAQFHICVVAFHKSCSALLLVYIFNAFFDFFALFSKKGPRQIVCVLVRKGVNACPKECSVLYSNHVAKKKNSLEEVSIFLSPLW